MSVAALKKQLEEFEKVILDEMNICFRMMYPFIDATKSKERALAINSRYIMTTTELGIKDNLFYEKSEYGGRVKDIDAAITFLNEFPNVMESLMKQYQQTAGVRWKKVMDDNAPLIFEANL